jgi:UDP-glucose 4-epimerase
MTILVTGGAGYIGSHTALALLQSGSNPLILDNLSNSSAESITRLEQIVGRAPRFVKGDVRDADLLKYLFAKYSVDAVLHFAGLKSVNESVLQPLCYYDNNLRGSQILLQEMVRANIFEFVFSSSATVYGEGVELPISETQPALGPMNPYGRSKLMVEDILRDLAASDERWRIAILRYFNPVGAHESGLIGEDSDGTPNNLMPYIAQVAVGKLPELVVFGNDYPTKDGTGVRDYIHVVDLAEGHLCALKALKTRTGVNTWNLGKGSGYTVLDMIQVFEKVSGRPVRYRFGPRRLGDIAVCYADPSKAERELGWKAKRSLSEMIIDSWRWQQMNPNGYR